MSNRTSRANRMTLTKQTIRELTPGELGDAVGGTSTMWTIAGEAIKTRSLPPTVTH